MKWLHRTCESKRIRHLLVASVFLPSFGSRNTHTVSVSGSIKCSTSQFYNFTSLVVEVWDGDQVQVVAEVDASGNFSKKYNGKMGIHSLVLAQKLRPKKLDKVEFVSDGGNKIFNLMLEACK